LAQFGTCITQAFENNSSYFNGDYFDSKSITTQFNFILFFAEILFDRIPLVSNNEFIDENTDFSKGDDDLELDGSDNLNPILRCSTHALFDRAYGSLVRILEIGTEDHLPPEVLIRYLYIYIYY
jgi:hypothetical protein